MKLFAVIEPDYGIIEQRRADLIDGSSGGHWIEPQRAHHEPCRHLPCIVVAGKTVRGIGVLLLHDIADVLLGLPCCACIVIEIGDVMAGLIAVIVIAAGKQRIDPKSTRLNSSHLSISYAL